MWASAARYHCVNTSIERTKPHQAHIGRYLRGVERAIMTTTASIEYDYFRFVSCPP